MNMKNGIRRHLRQITLVAACAVAGIGAKAQEELPALPGGDDALEVEHDPKAEKVGLMPYQKTPVDVASKERNPFASRSPEKKEEEVAEVNKEEDRIRLVLSELAIGGVSKSADGGLRVLLGDMKLERGAVVPQVLQDQTTQLMVAMITEEKIEFAWLEESGKGTGRRLVMPIDVTPKVSFVLNGQQSKAEEERAMGFQYFPSHHRRETGILSDSIGSLESQFAPE